MGLESYVIELWGETAGLVVNEGRSFSFHASSKAFSSLETRAFRSPGHAEDACHRLMLGRGPARRCSPDFVESDEDDGAHTDIFGQSLSLQ